MFTFQGELERLEKECTDSETICTIKRKINRSKRRRKGEAVCSLSTLIAYFKAAANIIATSMHDTLSRLRTTNAPDFDLVPKTCV